MEELSFKTASAFRSWLKKNAVRSNGIWLRIYKKSSSMETVSYSEALDQALCFGWIDGQKKRCDDQSWLQKFTPRKPKSRWSKRNTQHVDRLIKSGEMTPAGLKEVDAAKADGRWTSAYESASSATIPEDFLTQLNKNKKAKAFFETLNKAHLYSIVYRLQTAKKPETRVKRMKTIIDMLSKEKKFHD